MKTTKQSKPTKSTSKLSPEAQRWSEAFAKLCETDPDKAHKLLVLMEAKEGSRASRVTNIATAVADEEAEFKRHQRAYVGRIVQNAIDRNDSDGLASLLAQLRESASATTIGECVNKLAEIYDGRDLDNLVELATGLEWYAEPKTPDQKKLHVEASLVALGLHPLDAAETVTTAMERCGIETETATSASHD
jgi:hypothetical protein